jgi:hypothetical protein
MKTVKFKVYIEDLVEFYYKTRRRAPWWKELRESQMELRHILELHVIKVKDLSLRTYILVRFLSL